MTSTRRRLQQTRTLEERLIENIAQLRDQAKNMKPGVALDQVMRRIRENETAVHIREWLESPGLRAPR